MAKDRDQRTEQQTAKRKRENRKKGQVAKSPTLVGWVALLVATLVLPGAIARIGDRLAQGLRRIDDVAAQPEPGVLVGVLRDLCTSALTALAPVLLTAAAVALLGNLAQVGLVFTATPLKPKAERINPIAGFKRMFSAKSLWETGKQVLTMGVVLAVAVPSVLGIADSLLGSTWELGAALSNLGGSLVSLVRLVAAVGVVIGVADYAWARFNLTRDQRMTKEEVKREHRESEGDPHLKAKLRSTRLAMSQNRMLAAVADASVVITNPTHYAVALAYEPTQGAPKVVALGKDNMALRIRARALDAGVPTVESPPLAQALHRACRVDDEIPPELFQAVATVLAFVHRLGQRALAGTPMPLTVPDTWTRPGEDPEALSWRHRRRRRRRQVSSPTTKMSPLGREMARSAATRMAGRAR
ncbi:MAG TPA: EscU/YscU/HrcU family type III secretion system export apparatus switch protein [Microthrixaceae bacterium]|nr:EscU/YscU/HrcU family type III secretion system export apparatus switch protein [Microthrixaceae bacterium]